MHSVSVPHHPESEACQYCSTSTPFKFHVHNVGPVCDAMGLNFSENKSSNTVKPLNKGHIGDNINSLVLSFCREVVLFLEVVNVLKS